MSNRHPEFPPVPRIGHLVLAGQAFSFLASAGVWTLTAWRNPVGPVWAATSDGWHRIQRGRKNLFPLSLNEAEQETCAVSGQTHGHGWLAWASFSEADALVQQLCRWDEDYRIRAMMVLFHHVHSIGQDVDGRTILLADMLQAPRWMEFPHWDDKEREWIMRRILPRPPHPSKKEGRQ